MKRHSLTKKHIVLKISCEGCEYNGLKFLPTEELEYIDQIFAEFHFADTHREEWGILDIFRTLTKKFIPVSYRAPHWMCFDDK